MIIQFENVQLKLDEILNEDFSTSEFNGIEFNVLKLITSWFSRQDLFDFKTSGSTGISKQISIHRNKIEYSANATFKMIDPNGKTSSSLLCINPEFIGGAMVVFRAMIMKHDLRVIKPSSNPLEILGICDKYDVASMVPLQFQNSKIDDLNKIGTILIGGAAIDFKSNSQLKSNVYSTFGMTETISHIALKAIDSENYKTTGDTIIDTEQDGTLKIKGSITDNAWLKTNDIVEPVSEREFRWIGRKDFIINSGGVKLNPELIEIKLSEQILSSFLVSSLPDEQFGEKLILIIEGSQHTQIDYSNFQKYEIPKVVYFLPEIPRTSSGKIDRRAARTMLNDAL